MQITGTYTRAGAYLEPIAQGITLVIGTRTVPTPHKPKHYLLAKGMGKAPVRDKWISSLYPVAGCDGVYLLDHNRTGYVLELHEDQAVIRIAPAAG